MAGILKMSEATVIAFHSVAYLASKSDRLISTREMASELGVSENHLSKVMQRLVNAGIVKSIRGPKGGFQLVGKKTKISLIDIYKSTQGPILFSDCLLNKSECLGRGCIFGDLLSKVNKEFLSYLKKTTLGSLSNIYSDQ